MTASSVLITGASSGFGANVALALAESGWRVFASMRSLAKGESLLTRAAEKGVADRLSLVELDVTDAASVEGAVGTVLDDTGGTLDALLANAGYGAMGAFEDLSDAECRQQMETNFFGVLAAARAVLPTMRQAGRGRIVVVTSNAVNTPYPLMSMYAASKWALEGWAEAVAMELAPFGVAVRLVQPGAHDTAFGENVAHSFPAESAYRPLVETAMPGAYDLGRWSRDPAKATAPILRAITNPDAPFRTIIGEDTAAFAALKGLFPYELRAWVVRALLGLPGPERQDGEAAVLQQVMARITAAAARDSAEIASIAAGMVSQ